MQLPLQANEKNHVQAVALKKVAFLRPLPSSLGTKSSLVDLKKVEAGFLVS